MELLMSNVSGIGDAYYWSVFKIAEAFGLHRDTVKKRLLAANTCLLYTSIMMRERFNVLNHIIWAKPSGRWNGCNKESLRAYFPATERVLFAEHYQGPYRGKSDGYAAKERELKQHIMAPVSYTHLDVYKRQE